MQTLLFKLILLGSLSIACFSRPNFETLFDVSDNGVLDPKSGLSKGHQEISKTIHLKEKDLVKKGKKYQTSSARSTIIDDLNSVMIKTTSRLNNSACIVLNSIQTLESVTCSPGYLALTFATMSNSDYAFNQWKTRKIRFINGGQEWGCRNRTTGKPMMIMMKLVSNTFKRQRNRILVNVTEDNTLTPLVCFTNLTLNMTAEQENKKRSKLVVVRTDTAGLSSKIGVQNCLSFCSDMITFREQPLTGVIYKIGGRVLLNWSLNNKFDPLVTIRIVLKRKESWFNAPTSMASWSVQAGQNQFEFRIPSLPVSFNDVFFVEFQWSAPCQCQSKSYVKSTNEFRIPTRIRIVIDQTSPASLEKFYPGDTIRIGWAVLNANFSSTTKVRLSFRRYGLLLDTTLEQVLVSPSDLYFNYRISTQFPQSTSNDRYYFRIDWSTVPGMTMSDIVISDSKYFLILTTPNILPLLPALSDIYMIGDVVRITWKARNFDTASYRYFNIRLKRYRAFLWDETVDTLTTCTNVSAELCFHTLTSRIEPSIADFYYQFDWCEPLWGSSCTYNGNRFQIPFHTVGGWNYNADLDRASSQKTLLHYDCYTDTGISKPTLCNDDHKLSVDLTCTNCYMKYEYSVVHLNLSAQQGAINTMNFTLNSATTINIELLLSANHTYNRKDSLSLAEMTLLGFRYSIFNISFAFGFFLNIDLPYEIQCNATGQLSMGLQYMLYTNVTTTVENGTSVRKVNTQIEKKSYPLVPYMRSNIMIDVAIRPKLIMEAIVLSAAIQTEGYIRLTSEFRYPPFLNMSSNIYDRNISNPAIYHYSYPNDSCSNFHFARYYIQFGIRNSSLTVDLAINQITNFVNIPLQTHNQWKLFNDSPVYELASGCFFKALNTDVAWSKNLYFNISCNASSVFLDYLQSAFTVEIARTLNIPMMRILLNRVAGFYSLPSNHSICQTSITILPTLSSESSFVSVQSLAATFLQAISNSSSVVYTDTKWLKHLNKNLTLSL